MSGWCIFQLRQVFLAGELQDKKGERLEGLHGISPSCIARHILALAYCFSNHFIMQTSQPTAVQQMDYRNVKNLPRDANGERKWSNGLCGSIIEGFGTCKSINTSLDLISQSLMPSLLLSTGLLACFCPCIVYSKVKGRHDHLESTGRPHPSGGESLSGDCCVHCTLTSVFGMGWVLQVRQSFASVTRKKIANVMVWYQRFP